MTVPALSGAECSVLELSAGGITMAGALHLLPVFLLCGCFTLVPTRSDGDVPGSLSSAGTEAPTSADYDRTSSRPGKSNTVPRHPSGK